MENPVIIFGTKGLGIVALDIFQRNGVVVYGFLDDDKKLHQTEINTIPVLGETDDDGFLKLIGKKCEAFVAIEERIERKKMVEMLIEKRHIMPVNAIHADSIVSEIAELGHGNLIAARVILSPKAKIGNHCMIQTGAIIDHQVQIGNFVNIGSGSVIGAGAIIEDDVFIGTSAVIVGGVQIGKGASVGAGSVVIENVPAKARVFGNPAQKM